MVHGMRNEKMNHLIKRLFVQENLLIFRIVIDKQSRCQQRVMVERIIFLIYESYHSFNLKNKIIKTILCFFLLKTYFYYLSKRIK